MVNRTSYSKIAKTILFLVCFNVIAAISLQVATIQTDITIVEDMPKIAIETELQVATANGDIASVIAILKSPNETDDLNKSLHISIEKNFIEITKELLKAGANPNYRDVYSSNPLQKALTNLELLQLLINAGANVNEGHIHERDTPLISAVQLNKLETVKLLIQAGADVNKGNRYNETPLYFAAQRGYLDIVLELIKAKADLDATPSDRTMTPLCNAVAYGHIDIVEELILAGADVNLGSPLRIAYTSDRLERFEIANLLLEAGAKSD